MNNLASTYYKMGMKPFELGRISVFPFIHPQPCFPILVQAKDR